MGRRVDDEIKEQLGTVSKYDSSPTRGVCLNILHGDIKFPWFALSV